MHTPIEDIDHRGGRFALVVLIGVSAMLGQTAVAHSASAQDHNLAGDIWSEADGGRIVRAANATVYLWPDQPDVMRVIDSACTASKADMRSWIAARTALNDSSAPDFGNPAVAHDMAILRALAKLPHATIGADTVGHFAFSDIPYGSYWVEGETMFDSHLVQWWKKVILLDLPIGPLGVGTSSGSRMGPLEFHTEQFCVQPEPRLGAAAFMNDDPLVPTDRVYEASEVERPARVLSQGEKPEYPEQLRKEQIPGQITMSFVVDKTGRAAMNTVRVLHTTGPDLEAPVRRSLASMIFAPAEINGQPVRSRAVQTFNFDVLH